MVASTRSLMDDDDLDTGLVRRPRRIAPAIAVLALLAAAGLGVLLLRERQARDLAVQQLATQADQQKSLTDALELLRTSSTDVTGQLSSCKQALDQGDSVVDEKQVSLEANLAACQASIKDLEVSKGGNAVAAILAARKGLAARFAGLVARGKLDVTLRHGKMVLKLPASVLFATGSAELSAGGKEAIAEVAAVLRTLSGRRFVVAGHTDNVGSGNWELSTARAVTVTQLLVADGLPPGRLAAAGYGEFDPVASNLSPKGRQKNRRIEIVLEPDLTPLSAAKRPAIRKKIVRRPSHR
jgi:chemotaxis protein MotB